jgi:hypothetical protein
MTRQVNGLNSFSYLGVNATNPPNMIVLTRAPTTADTKNVSIGDFWLNKTTEILYQLTSLADDTATWVTIASSSSDITGDFTVTNTASSTVSITSGTGNTTLASTRAVYIDAAKAGDSAVVITATNATGGIDLVSGTNGKIQIDGGTNGLYLNSPGATGTTISNGTDNAQIIVGTGDPNTNPTTGLKGSLFIRTDALSAATTLYVNTDGMTAWTALS